MNFNNDGTFEFLIYKNDSLSIPEKVILLQELNIQKQNKNLGCDKNVNQQRAR